MFGRYTVNNNVRVALHANINAVATSLTVVAASGVFNNPADPAGDVASGGIGIATLVDSLSLPTKTEIVTYTSLTDNGNGTFTLGGLVRGMDGTSGQSWLAGAVLIQTITAGMLRHPMVYITSGPTIVFDLAVEFAGDLSFANQVDARSALGLGNLAVLSTVDNGNWSGAALSVANGGTGASNAAGARTNLGLGIGSDVQAFHATLSGIAGIPNLLGPGTGADAYRVPMRSGSGIGGAWGAMPFSAYGTALVGGATLADMRATLGVTIGADVQAFHANLGGIASVSMAGTGTGGDAFRVPVRAGTALGGNWGSMSFSANGVALVGGATLADMRATLGLGSLATQSAVNNANWSGTDLAVANGGTGASDAAGARTNLGIPELDSGTYTPTLTNGANVAASSNAGALYSRVGNIVTVSGACQVDPTATNTVTELGISLPIASALTGVRQVIGVAVSGDVAGMSGMVFADAANDRATLRFVHADVSNRTWSFNFQYQVL